LFLVGQSVVGVLVSILFAAFIILTDAWGVATLISNDASPILSAALFIGMGIAMFAPLVVATSIFLAASSPDVRQ
jgi:hypothetical protein